MGSVRKSVEIFSLGPKGRQEYFPTKLPARLGRAKPSRNGGSRRGKPVWLVPTIASKILVASLPKSLCLHGIRYRLGSDTPASGQLRRRLPIRAQASRSRWSRLAPREAAPIEVGWTISGDIEADSCSAAKPAEGTEPAGDPCNTQVGERGPRNLLLTRASQTRRVSGRVPFAVVAKSERSDNQENRPQFALLRIFYSISFSLYRSQNFLRTVVMNPNEPPPHLTAKIVSKYVCHHTLAATQLPELINTVHQAIVQAGQPAQKNEARTPAVSVRQSVRQDYVVCLD